MVYRKADRFLPFYRRVSASRLTGALMHRFWDRGSQKSTHRPVFLSGSPRSGSSWSLETLEAILPARRHWEPVKGFQHEIGYRNGPFGGIRPWIDGEDDLPELQWRLRESLMGERPPAQVSRMYNPKEGVSGTLRRVLSPGVTILKFTAAQRLLPWIVGNIDCQGAMIVRNPLSIVASAKKMGSRVEGWGGLRSEERNDPALLQRFPAAAALEAEDLTNIRYLAIRTCLDLMVPLQDENCLKSLVVVPYESLTIEPSLFLAIASELGLGELLETDTVPVRPSATTVGDSNVLKKGNPNLSWQHRLEPWEIDQVQRVMDAFGINFYGESPECDLSRLKATGVQRLLG